MSSVLVGIFDSHAAASQASARLMSAGFTDDAVTLTGGTATSSSSTPTQTTGADAPEDVGALSRFFSSIFSNDADGRVGAGDAGNYQEAFRRGSCGVSVVTSSESEVQKAEQILNDCGAVDIDEQVESWRKEGWTRSASAADSPASTLDAGATHKLQEVEEKLEVGKRAVSKGGVRIFTRTTEVPVTETVRLREEHADIKRTEVDRPATEADFAAFKEGSIDVPEMGEEAVVSKTARVTGEVEIGKTATEREETINDTVRKTKVDVEQLDGDGVSGDAVSLTGASSAASSGSANRDPITGEPGAHPVGTGIGAAAGGIAAGAAVGSVAGPVGTAVGAAVGAVAGGLAGKGVAEEIDPTTGEPVTK